jgi:hypothetical protein
MHLSPFFKWLYYHDIEPNTRPKPPIIESVKEEWYGPLNRSQTQQAEGTTQSMRSQAKLVHNPLVKVEYKDRQSKAILTTQDKSTLKILWE